MKHPRYNTKWNRLVALAVCLGMVLCGCGGVSAAPAEPPAGPPDAQSPEEEADAAMTETPDAGPALIPWGEELPVTQQAISTKSMIVCFMSGEGLAISGGSSKSAFGDTKWGDSTLIAFPNGETMLIDGGMADYGPMLVQNLKALGVTRLDSVVLTHYHDDHYGGLLSSGGVFDSLEVGTVCTTEVHTDHSSVPGRLEAQAGQNGARCQRLYRGDTLEAGEVTIEVLWPGEDYTVSSNGTAQEMNDGSIVLRVDYKEVSALFTGDLYTTGELALLQSVGHGAALKADILKIPHHGRSTSSSRDFIAAVSPSVAVALGAVAMETTTYTSYVRSGAKVCMDLYDGYVKVTTDGETLEYETSRVRDIRSYDKIDAAFGGQSGGGGK